MSYKYIIDAYAWIEYFRASKAGAIARKYIESEYSATATIVIAEISRKLQREIEAGNESEEGKLKRLEFIRASSQVIDLDFETAVRAGEVDVDLKKKVNSWGLADSIILCTARNVEGKVITGDEHFRSLEDAIMIKET